MDSAKPADRYLYLTGRMTYRPQNREGRESLLPGVILESWLRETLGNGRVDWLLENHYLLVPKPEAGLEQFQVIRLKTKRPEIIPLPEECDETEDLSGDHSGHST